MSEAATLPVINPEPETVASKKHEIAIIASGVRFASSIVASGHVYIHGQLTGNIETKEHLVRVIREDQAEDSINCRELIIDSKVQGQCRGDSTIVKKYGHLDGTLACRALVVKKGGVFSGHAEMLAAVENKSHVLGLATDTPSKIDTGPARPRST